MTLSPIGPSRDKSKVSAVADPRDAGGLAEPDCPGEPLEDEEAILAKGELHTYIHSGASAMPVA